MHNLSRSSLRLHEAVELRQQHFIANNGRRRRDVCLGLPERENVPGHLIGQTRDGGEQGVGFGTTAVRERSESQKCSPRQHVPPAPLVGDQLLARDELCLSVDQLSCDRVCVFVVGESTGILDVS